MRDDVELQERMYLRVGKFSCWRASADSDSCRRCYAAGACARPSLRGFGGIARRFMSGAERVRLATWGVGSMRTSERINTLWSLARNGSREGERLRHQIAAIGAL